MAMYQIIQSRVHVATLFSLLLSMLICFYNVNAFTSLGNWAQLRNLVAAYENVENGKWEISLKFEARAHSKHRCTNCQTPPWLAPWLYRPRVMYAISNNDRPKKQWTSSKTDYYFHSRAGVNNKCPKYEELEKEAVDKFVPFERKKTIEKTYVDAFKNDGYGTVKVSMAIQNQRQRIYRDKEACWRHDACGAYQGDYTYGWKNHYCSYLNDIPKYYVALNPRFYCVKNSPKPKLNGYYELDKVEKFSFDADHLFRKLVYVKTNCLQDSYGNGGDCTLRHDDVSSTKIKLSLRGANTGQTVHYSKEFSHSNTWSRFQIDASNAQLPDGVVVTEGRCNDPGFANGYPKVDNFIGPGNGNKLDLKVRLTNSEATVKYIIVGTASNNKPSGSETVAGTGKGGVTPIAAGAITVYNPETEFSLTVLGLDDFTSYDVFFVIVHPISEDITGNVEEIVKQTGDGAPPNVATNYPKTKSLSSNGATIAMKLNEKGECYYSVIDYRAGTNHFPTAVQVFAGQNKDGKPALVSGNCVISAGDTEVSHIISGSKRIIRDNTDYNVAVVCEDHNGSPKNKQTQVSALSFKTTVDNVPPQFIQQTPKLATPVLFKIFANVSLNEDGKVFYQCKRASEAAPSISSMFAIDTISNLQGSAQFLTESVAKIEIFGLDDDTAYSIYFAAKDNSMQPTKTTSLIKKDITSMKDTEPPIFFEKISVVSSTPNSLVIKIVASETGIGHAVIVPYTGTPQIPTPNQIKGARNSLDTSVGSGAYLNVTLLYNSQCSKEISTACGTVTFTNLQDSTQYAVYATLEDNAKVKNLATESSSNTYVTYFTTKDTTAPTFLTNFPKVLQPTAAGYNLAVTTGEPGTCYYVNLLTQLNVNTDIPSKEQVRQGKDAKGVTLEQIYRGNFALVNDNSATYETVSTLSEGRYYKVVVTCSDGAKEPNYGNTWSATIHTVPDTIAPEFSNGYPIISQSLSNKIIARTKLSESGSTYFAIFLHTDNTPQQISDLELKRQMRNMEVTGALSMGKVETNGPTSDVAFLINGLNKDTRYKVYIFAIDNALVPNNSSMYTLDTRTIKTNPTFDLSANKYSVCGKLFRSTKNHGGMSSSSVCSTTYRQSSGMLSIANDVVQCNGYDEFCFTCLIVSNTWDRRVDGIYIFADDKWLHWDDDENFQSYIIRNGNLWTIEGSDGVLYGSKTMQQSLRPPEGEWDMDANNKNKPWVSHCSSLPNKATGILYASLDIPQRLVTNFTFNDQETMNAPVLQADISIQQDCSKRTESECLSPCVWLPGGKTDWTTICEVENVTHSAILKGNALQVPFIADNIPMGYKYNVVISIWNAVGQSEKFVSLVNTMSIGNPTKPTIYNIIGEKNEAKVKIAPTKVSSGSPTTSCTVYLRECNPLCGDTYKSYRFMVSNEISEVGAVLTVSNLTNGVQYAASIRVTNNAGYSSSESSLFEFTPVGLPSVPVNMTVIPGDGLVDIYWKGSLNDAGSKIIKYTVGLRNESTWIDTSTCPYLKVAGRGCMLEVTSDAAAAIDYINILDTSRGLVQLTYPLPSPHFLSTSLRITFVGEGLSTEFLNKEFSVSNILDQTKFEFTHTNLPTGNYRGQWKIVAASFHIKFKGLKNNEPYYFGIFGSNNNFEGHTFNIPQHVVPLSGNTELKTLWLQDKNNSILTMMNKFKQETHFSSSHREYRFLAPSSTDKVFLIGVTSTVGASYSISASVAEEGNLGNSNETSKFIVAHNETFTEMSISTGTNIFFVNVIAVNGNGGKYRIQIEKAGPPTWYKANEDGVGLTISPRLIIATDTKIMLTWDHAVENNSPLQGYEVYMYPNYTIPEKNYNQLYFLH